MIARLLAFVLFCLIGTSPVFGSEQTFPVKNLHHSLEVTLNPDRQSLSIKDVITFSGEGLVSFSLSPRFFLMEMFLNGLKTGPIARESEFIFALKEKRERHRLTLIYTGQLKDLETYRQQSTKYRGFIDPQGTFLPASSGWYPQFETEHFTYDLTVKTPALHKVVAPGKIVAEITERGVNQTRFEVDHPIYEIPLFAGPYQVKEKRMGTTRIRTYFHPTLNGLEDDYLEATEQYIKRYSKEISPYPYSAFHIVSSPLPFGYGFPYLTYMGANVLRLPFIKYSSLGHEVLHNWWGNGVWADYEKGNWVEGLTTYMADYAYMADRGPEKAKERRLEWLRDYAALPTVRDMPVTKFTSKAHTASQVVGYNKVAFIFHMLRQKIGEETFAQGIQRFWQVYKFKRAGWADMQRVFEEVSNQRLERFFDQWLNRKGAPRLGVSHIALEGNSLKLEIHQKGQSYDLTLPIAINGQAFSTNISGPSTLLTLPFTGQPKRVELDPNFELFRHLAKGEAPPILRDVTLSSNTKVVVLGQDQKFKATARKLAQRMMDTRVQLAKGDIASYTQANLLVIGTNKDIKDLLSRDPLLHPRERLPQSGTLTAWAAERANGVKIVLVSAQNHQSLKDVLRPLPHYGRRSYVVFEGSKAMAKGVWQNQ